MFRVLAVGFGPVAVRGIRSILQSPEFLVEECEADAMTDLAPHFDVLIIQAGPQGGSAPAETVAAHRPDSTVVVCSSERTDMRVRPAGAGDTWQVQQLSATVLLDGVRS